MPYPKKDRYYVCLSWEGNPLHSEVSEKEGREKYLFGVPTKGEHPLIGHLYKFTGEWARSPEEVLGRDRDPIGIFTPYGEPDLRISLCTNGILWVIAPECPAELGA